MPPISTNILLSNHLEHILFQRLIILVRNPHLFSCIFQPLHLLKFFLRILKSNMGVNIKCHGNILMPHEVLQCLRIHAGFRHVRAICMTAYMGCDIGHLYLINLVVPAHHTVKSVFPVHGNHRHSVLIQKKKSSVSTYHFLHLIFWSILNDCSKHFCNFFCHWNYPCSGIRLCRLNHILRSSICQTP